MPNRTIQDFRYFLKDSIRKEIDFSNTDQNRGIPPPPPQRPIKEGQIPIELIPKEAFKDDYSLPLTTAMDQRRSIRQFSDSPLNLKELSFLLWATQGVRDIMGPAVTLRIVPSAGARHSIETYLYIRNVDGPTEGIYRYLPLTHQLVKEFEEDGLSRRIAEATYGQRFAGQGALTFFWATIPYRTEWRYDRAAARVIAFDVGHVCQNLYLACEAIDAGTCGIGAYDQEEVDELLRLDGEEEFVIYLAPVGKKM